MARAIAHARPVGGRGIERPGDQQGAGGAGHGMRGVTACTPIPLPVERGAICRRSQDRCGSGFQGGGIGLTGDHRRSDQQDLGTAAVGRAAGGGHAHPPCGGFRKGRDGERGGSGSGDWLGNIAARAAIPLIGKRSFAARGHRQGGSGTGRHIQIRGLSAERRREIAKQGVRSAGGDRDDSQRHAHRCGALAGGTVAKLAGAVGSHAPQGAVGFHHQTVMFTRSDEGSAVSHRHGCRAAGVAVVDELTSGIQSAGNQSRIERRTGRGRCGLAICVAGGVGDPDPEILRALLRGCHQQRPVGPMDRTRGVTG